MIPRKRYIEERREFQDFMKHYPFTLEDLPGELWAPIEGHECYQVSTFGRVKSYKFKKARIIRPFLNPKNYSEVVLFKRNSKEYFRIHRLVAETFIPNPDNKPQVNHIDGCKFNACVTNLEWVTAEENMAHAVRIGLQKSGEDNYQAGVSNEQVHYIRENPDGLTLKQLSKKFGVAFTKISEIQTGKSYKNAGGTIREAHKYTLRLSDETRNEIRNLYVKGSSEFGSRALGKKYGVDHSTILNIIHEND